MWLVQYEWTPKYHIHLYILAPSVRCAVSETQVMIQYHIQIHTPNPNPNLVYDLHEGGPLVVLMVEGVPDISPSLHH